ncbi:hypothetical protein [Saccharothrix australiensis]|uniref:hypothetical protein n=1 Tax=Saccharothrix australiensis TaxID=2072 RepID=UPI0011C45A9B|nr:hypothetical protein [Saccharothrix australiensis]
MSTRLDLDAARHAVQALPSEVGDAPGVGVHPNRRFAAFATSRATGVSLAAAVFGGAVVVSIGPGAPRTTAIPRLSEFSVSARLPFVLIRC